MSITIGAAMFVIATIGWLISFYQSIKYKEGSNKTIQYLILMAVALVLMKLG